MTSNRPLHLRLAAVSGTALLAIAGSTGASHAQGAGLDLGLGAAVEGSLGALGLNVELAAALGSSGGGGSPLPPASLDQLSSGSGEGSGEGSLGEGSLETASGQGSGEGSGELSSGSLAPLGSTTASAAGSLPILLPVVLIGGSIAGAPMIQQSVANLNIQLPVLPGFPPLAGSAIAGPALVQPVAEASPAPGPTAPNGRGGESGTAGGGVVGAARATVMSGSLGDYEIALPAGVTLPPLPFIR